MNIDLEQRFKDNAEILEDHGVHQIARSGLVLNPELNELPENLRHSESVAELALVGLTREMAVVLARSFIDKVDPDNNGSLVDTFDESIRRSHRDEPLNMKKIVSDEGFIVKIGQNKFNDYSLQIDLGPRHELDPKLGRTALHAGFIAAMSEVGLRPVYHPEPAETSTERLPRRFRRVRTGERRRVRRDISRENKGSNEPENFERDLSQAHYFAMLMGLDVETQINELPNEDKDFLVDLWVNRNRSPEAMIDLFMHAVTEKIKYPEELGIFPSITLDDLLGLSGEYSILDMRHHTEKSSIDTLISRVHMPPNKAESALMSIKGDVEALRFRYLTWLAAHPAFELVAREMEFELSGGHMPNQRDLNKLYKVALDNIKNIGEVHHRAKKDYRDTGAGRNAYNQRIEFLKAAWLLGVYIFTDQDISTVMKDVRK
jgi:hypothetical protein